MATSTSTTSLPPLYSEIEPVRAKEFGSKGIDRSAGIPQLSTMQAVPVTVGEFAQVQRVMPIVFASGDQPAPLGLMGASNNRNVFFNADGATREKLAYTPAYLRRFPFLLVKATDESEELTLCIESNSTLISNSDHAEPLYDGDEPTEFTKAQLDFCRQYELQRQQTASFVEILRENDLLIDGQTELEIKGREKAIRLRGFQIVDRERLDALDTERLAELHKSGVLGLIVLHLVSLGLISEIVARQLALGWDPEA